MEKHFKPYHSKGAFELKDIDPSKRTVALYLAAFDNIDSDSDILRKGCFAKSIAERGPLSAGNRKIQYLRYHDFEHQVGKWDELAEDDKGLYAVGTLSNSTKGNDLLCDYQDGVVREHSIGFSYVQDKLKWVEDMTLPNGGYWEVTEVKLWEGSAVTFGANSETPFVGMKSEQKKDEAMRISARIDTLVKAIRKGEGTDERIQNLELQVKVLNSQLVSLIDVEPFKKEHSQKNEPESDLVTIFEAIKELKKQY